MQNLADFMKETRDNVPSLQTAQSIHFVISNASCDMPGMVCTLCLAFHYYTMRYKGTNTIVIPLQNVDSEKFRTRTLNIYILRKFGLNHEDLVFRNQINLNKISQNCLMKITLISHQILSQDTDYLRQYVHEVYDNRTLRQANYFAPQVRLHLEDVASTATLVAIDIFRGKIKCLCTTAILIYSAIIFDTMGFDSNVGNITEMDEFVTSKIEEAIGITQPRLEYFNELWNAYNDITGLAPIDILNKNVIQVEEVLVPELSLLVIEYLQMPNALDNVRLLCKQHEAHCVVMMGFGQQDGAYKRDIGLFSTNPNMTLIHIIRQHLVNVNRNIDLNIVKTDFTQVIYYEQKNTHFSRDDVLPIIRTCVNTYHESNPDKRKGKPSVNISTKKYRKN